MSAKTLSFPPFTLDPTNGCLWRGRKQVSLLPKAFAVLSYLAAHPGQLVAHEELLKAVWPDTAVSHDVLKACMRRIRRALNDHATAPRFIETVHRRGYRFIAPVTTASPVSGSKFQVSGSAPPAQPEHGGASSPQLETWNMKLETHLVGREAELKQLHARWAKALNGER
jgi:DNA-binding winged helix-turn-helix (wHTH) protein